MTFMSKKTHLTRSIQWDDKSVFFHGINVLQKIYSSKTFRLEERNGGVWFVCLFVLLLYVSSQQLWSWGDGHLT